MKHNEAHQPSPNLKTKRGSLKWWTPNHLVHMSSMLVKKNDIETPQIVNQHVIFVWCFHPAKKRLLSLGHHPIMGLNIAHL